MRAADCVVRADQDKNVLLGWWRRTLRHGFRGVRWLVGHRRRRIAPFHVKQWGFRGRVFRPGSEAVCLW